MMAWAILSVLCLGTVVFLGVGMAVGGLNDDPAMARWVVGCAVGGFWTAGVFFAVVAMRYRRRWLLDKAAQ